MTQYLFILLCLCMGVTSYAAGTKMAVGLELGGNGTMMLSDPSVQIFAGGAGLQGSLFFSMWNEKPIGAKLRYEIVGLQEDALQKSATNYITNGTYLKSMTQSWSFLSIGAEGRFQRHGQAVFWEGLLGYAFSRGGSMNVAPFNYDQPVQITSQDTSSALVLSGGVGIKRVFSERITGIMSLRSFILLSPIYGSTTLVNKTLIPLPVMFNVGIEVPFEI